MIIKSVLKVLFSNRLTTVLLLLFAVAMGYGTFLENDFGTQAVQTVVYRAWWFELLMFLLGLNFIGNIFKYRLFRKEKAPILTFHLAFILILIGAAITRYISFEGMMHIREGAQSNELISQDRYLQISYSEDGVNKTYEKKLVLSYFSQPNIDITLGSGETQFEVSSHKFVPQAEQTIVEGVEGSTVITVVSSTARGRENLYLQSGGFIRINSVLLTLDNPIDGAINIIDNEGQLLIISPISLSYMVMATQAAGTLPVDSSAVLQLRALYQSQNVAFVIPEVYRNSSVAYHQSDDKERAKRIDDMLFVTLEGGGQKEELILNAFNGQFSEPKHIDINGNHLDVSYGPKSIKLPFAIELLDFQLERYPGSVSPSSYASEVNVIDGEEKFPYRIYMNNVLDHRGFRFFQASYDTDELGTVLSVNKDFWGTLVTYIGYFLLGLGMFLTLFTKNSRFQHINRRLSGLNEKKVVAAISLIILFISFDISAQDEFSYPDNIAKNIILEEHATNFGTLLVQDLDGRIKPINTLSSEFLRKVHGKTSFNLEGSASLTSDQVFLMINANPIAWQDVPIIKIDAKKGAAILEKLEINTAPKYLKFRDFVDAQGNYRLLELVETATRKKPAERNNLDKEVISVDERFNVYFQGLTGYFLKIFPLESDPANTWFNSEIQRNTFNSEDSLFIVNVLPFYYQSLLSSSKSNDWAEPIETLGYLQTFQTVKGAKVIPPTSIQEAEIFYNKLALFNHLFGYFWICGLLLLVTALFRMFYQEKKLLKLSYLGLLGLIAIGFAALTFNLILRWYAAQYPPWSNGYEMLILVAWALLLFGFVFMRKSEFVVALAALFTGTLLFIGFLDWLNPEITNLVPVLKSYWLKIHVAIIVGSYAPLGLSAVLGLLALILMSVDRSNNLRIKKSIKELTYINEMSMTIGLFMLAIGTFLGGVWANESWGRYWGWDPKETWALISVIIYASVVHLRLIPKLNDLFVFNVASLWAFFSIIMTSFGVNYYLAGLHSYAKGDPLPIPQFVYWLVLIFIAISVIANINYRKTKHSLIR